MIVIAIIWIAVVLFLSVFLGRTPKGRGWISIIVGYRRFRFLVCFFVVLCFFIAVGYALFPGRETGKIPDSRQAYVEYSRQMLEKMVKGGILSIDSQCTISAPLPELAYSLPALLDAYRAEVKKPTLPRLLRLDDTLSLSFDGYKQFKNRGIRIVKRVQKRLGPRYSVKIVSTGSNHRLELAYKGSMWSDEQLCSLPVMEASLKEDVDPAILMSVVRHVSNFRFDYRAPRGGVGLLALDSGEGLEQIFMGAALLSRALKQTDRMEDALVLFYPVREHATIHEEWRNNPLKQSWIEEVLRDLPYYRENGLVDARVNAPAEDSLTAESIRSADDVALEDSMAVEEPNDF